jgi:hypothetical protein
MVRVGVVARVYASLARLRMSAKASINRKLPQALVRLAPPEVELSGISFQDSPLYSYNYDADFPPAAKEFRGP